MNVLEDVLPPALLRALGYTLLHSLWQGALIGLAAALLLMVLQRHTAAVRYWVAAGALTCLLALTTATGAWYYTTAPTLTAPHPAQTEAQAAPHAAPVLAEVTSQPTKNPFSNLLQVGAIYAEQHLPLLVTAWLLGMLAMLLRLLASLAYVQRLRHYRVAALPAPWQERLETLTERAGLQHRVQLLASALVPSPMVVGLFRPIILLPLGLATGLPRPQLEMILAHEIAHVLRRDYLFNLLQSVTETIFFYHPAVWYLAAALRTERENCCDDIATHLYGDARLLAQALSAVAELQYTTQHARTRTPRLAMAALGPDGSLLGRVRRLVQHAPAMPTFAEGFAAAVVLIVGAGLVVGSAVFCFGEPSQPAQEPATHTPALAAGQSFGKEWPAGAPRTSQGARDSTDQVAQAAARSAVAAKPAAAGTSATSPDPWAIRQQQLALLKEIQADPKLRASTGQATLVFQGKSLAINGHPQPAAVAARYRRLLHVPHNPATGKVSGVAQIIITDAH
ncbi:M56 family metallopeptidase [Hymenobacter sp. CRA2]|uniref:M56 family metallopeptidase n=1 Tax=Hymenobacter sp. CRA2 TaxID=1955620 RepID=UPI00098FBE7A|nr:M56 family metallopeptidase [Hymenobacter sp. CRA2]OON70566.1 hypothetical protein B0919_00635 [Hymenobacter sp. CRA2]